MFNFRPLILDLSDHRWCLKHREWMDSHGTNGELIARFVIHELMYHDNNFMRLTKGKADNMNKVIAEIAPVCCYIGEPRIGDFLRRATVHIS